MPQQTVTVRGKRYVMVEERELRRLKRVAAQAEAATDRGQLPEYPPAYADGNYPAVEYARVSIARKIIQDRRAAGLTQQALADRSGVRVETISRLESGKHSPTVRTVEKIDRVLQSALKQSRKAGAKKR
jgi:ribosome-binding protein aMBF1 (putative translation factor)